MAVPADIRLSDPQARPDDPPARLLFIPVSGPRGMGEYARASAIALAAGRRWPQIEIRFALSRNAAYAVDTPFPATFLPSSPTFHSREVAALIREFRPTLVLFDNAGRTSQLRAAVAGGARTVFISSRPRQRRRAFRLRWMRLLDEHWIAYPEFIAGAVGPLERLKLLMLGRPKLRYLDTVLPAIDRELAASAMAGFGVRAGEYVLVVPGGGTGHPGALSAPQIVAEAAHRIALQSYPTILVGVTPQVARVAPSSHELKVAPRLPVAMLIELIRGARLVISNGGDTMLQALACKRPCVAVPIAGDQALRIKQCVKSGLVARARLDADDLERVALRVLATDGAELVAHASGPAGPMVTDGMEAALAAIGRLARLHALPIRPQREPAPTQSEPGPHEAPALAAPRLLFLPVSGPHGMGEYVRAVQVAQAAAARWPMAQIQFAVSREAPDDIDAGFARTLLPSSPTFHTPEVIALIEKMRPQIVVFDNAGRTAQLRAARRVGARIVYVSARARQRRKAFRLRWMALIDEHWIAYPELLAGPLSRLERLKLRWLGRPLLRYLDVLLPRADAHAATAVLQRLGLSDKSYVLLVPGGGTGHPGARDAVQVFAAAARDLASRGITSVLVASNGEDYPAAPGLRTLPRLPLAELAALMRRAELVVANGGSTLLQAIACQAPSIGVSIAKDQMKRVRQCAAAGLARAAPGRRPGHRACCDRGFAAAPSLCAIEYFVPHATLLAYRLDQPSFRYRMQTLVGPLERAGWTVRVERFPSRRYGVRIWERRELFKRSSVVVLHQIKLAGAEARLLASFAPRMIFDYDDAIYVRRPRRLGEPADESWWRRQKFAATCRAVSVVASGNDVLAAAAAPYAHRVVTLPTALDVSRYRASTATQENPPTIVWIGSPENLVYLEILRPALARLSERHPALRLRIICSSFLDWPDVRTERVLWSPETEVESLASSHIGVMPLSDDEWSRGKCAFKLLQYMAASLPCVASPVGANTEAVIEERTGLHARGTDEWEQALERLIGAPSLRARFGAAGRAHVESRYSLPLYQSRYVELFKSLAD